jgi:hypothetical protein
VKKAKAAPQQARGARVRIAKLGHLLQALRFDLDKITHKRLVKKSGDRAPWVGTTGATDKRGDSEGGEFHGQPATVSAV